MACTQPLVRAVELGRPWRGCTAQEAIGVALGNALYCELPEQDHKVAESEAALEGVAPARRADVGDVVVANTRD